MSEPIAVEDIEGEAQEMRPEVSPIETLRAIMATENLVEHIDGDRLGTIAADVVSEYEIDVESRKEWHDRTKEAMKLATLVAEQKSYPFDGAANVKYPLLTVAALQFNARAYPAIVSGKDVVKCQTWGNDPQGIKAARAKRVADFSSYQLLSQMPEWEEDTDKLLVIIPIVGCAFRKMYYDPALKRSCSRLVMADSLVVNYHARSLADVPRITEEMPLYPNEIEERIRSGRYVDFEYGRAEADPQKPEDKAADDKTSPHLFLEQHRLLDLDEDGYPEPYIVTVHKQSATVVRIVANFDSDGVTFNDDGIVSIRKRDYYIKYPFMPSPDGGFYDWGFGWLLKDIGESINTTLNQMLDAGHLANMQGGLISSALGLREKKIRLQPGEWKMVQATGPINQAIMPMNYPGPSAVLFNLLGALIEAGREVANIKDVLTGDQNVNAPATTTLALIEQGMQVFNSIYKRIHRALRKELELLARINVETLDPEEYAAFFDAQGEQEAPPNPQEDYALRDMDIMPVTDPQVASRAQELARAEFLRQWAVENPLANQPEVQKRVLEAAQVEDVDKLIRVPEPDPLEQIMRELLVRKGVNEAHKLEAEIDKMDAEVVEKYTNSIRNLASAEGEQEGNQLSRLKLLLDAITAQEQLINGRGRPGAMENQPGNPMGVQGGAGPNAGNGGGRQGPVVSLIDGGASGMGAQPAGSGLPEGGL